MIGVFDVITMVSSLLHNARYQIQSKKEVEKMITKTIRTSQKRHKRDWSLPPAVMEPLSRDLVPLSHQSKYPSIGVSGWTLDPDTTEEEEDGVDISSRGVGSVCAVGGGLLLGL